MVVSPEDWPSYDKRCCPVYCSESLRAGPACRLGSTDKGCTATSYIELPQPIPSGNLARTKPNYAAHSSESGWPNASPSSCWIIKYGVFLTLGSYHWLTISSQHCFSTLRHSTYRSLIRAEYIGQRRPYSNLTAYSTNEYPFSHGRTANDLTNPGTTLSSNSSLEYNNHTPLLADEP